MTRVRSAAQRAPQTIQAATALLERYAAVDAQIAGVDLFRRHGLAQVNAAADAVVVPLHAELKDIVKQLKPWWAASIDALTGGKAKSIKLGGCLVGYRFGNATVTYSNGDDDAAVAAARAAKLDELVRIAPSLDKPAVLRLLESAEPDLGDDADEAAVACAQARAEARAKAVELGFGVKRTESFFVDRIPPKPVEVIDVEDAGDAVA